MYRYSKDYLVGIIDCRASNDFGTHFKFLANQFKNEGNDSFFANSENIRMTENERIEHFLKHSEKHQTFLILDNFEELLNEDNSIKSHIIEYILQFFLERDIKIPHFLKLLAASPENLCNRFMQQARTKQLFSQSYQHSNCMPLINKLEETRTFLYNQN